MSKYQLSLLQVFDLELIPVEFPLFLLQFLLNLFLLIFKVDNFFSFFLHDFLSEETFMLSFLSNFKILFCLVLFSFGLAFDGLYVVFDGVYNVI